MRTARKQHIYRLWLYPLLLTTAVFVLYLNNLSAPFQLDDHSNIVDQPRAMMTEFSFASLVRVFRGIDYGEGYYNYTRGLVFITFALNHWLSGLNVESWHMVNNLIHAINTALLFLLLYSLFMHDNKQRRSSTSWLLFFIALLWGLNPLHTQTVTYIVQRLTLLATLFVLLGMLFWVHYIRTARKTMLAFCLISVLVATTCKEIAFVAPFLMLFLWMALTNKQATFLTTKRFWGWFLGLFIAIIAAAISMHGNTFDLVDRMSTTLTISAWERLLTQMRVVWMYLSLMFYPDPRRLTLDHHIEPSIGLFQPWTTFFAGVALFASLLFAIYSMRRRPLVSFGIFWYFGCLVLESTILPLELMFEHRSYLPTVGVIIALTACLQEYLAGTDLRRAPVEIDHLNS